MPMDEPDDFALGDTSAGWCRHCCHDDGTLQSYEECLARMTAFVVRTEGLGEGEAQVRAAMAMSKLPAWQGRAAN
jgi:hypothetical protein